MGWMRLFDAYKAQLNALLGLFDRQKGLMEALTTLTRSLAVLHSSLRVFVDGVTPIVNKKNR